MLGYDTDKTTVGYGRGFQIGHMAAGCRGGGTIVGLIN